ncbi:hypothetical protein RIU76_06415 [Latilactobacillus sakei subsp. sakei]|uniref:hypothetical protein n=1 Tax=Latilactobacillus sakei TaxID=1599 RepID=UPI002861C1D1|nr:hypothetical protein [Latilactobacillus sakei]MDR7924358.1 hypothetical protein [Latilactobacillus sakei subsp. sakei]
MTKGTIVSITNYSAAVRIIDIQSDGLVIQDDLDRQYFCLESELTAITESERMRLFG